MMIFYEFIRYNYIELVKILRVTLLNYIKFILIYTIKLLVLLFILHLSIHKNS